MRLGFTPLNVICCHYLQKCSWRTTETNNPLYEERVPRPPRRDPRLGLPPPPAVFIPDRAWWRVMRRKREQGLREARERHNRRVIIEELAIETEMVDRETIYQDINEMEMIGVNYNETEV